MAAASPARPSRPPRAAGVHRSSLRPVGGWIRAARTGIHPPVRAATRSWGEVEAKRRILDLFEETETWAGQHEGAHYGAQYLADVAKLLALPYTAHPGYRDAWRP
ncbi:DUF6221 family protein [Actinomadura madurae]|uniref:DUF6221 family protein n=1 Tax=Actinomadura madurae TaxID=1993 RepID=UPI00399B581B